MTRTRIVALGLVVLLLVAALGSSARAQARPEGEMRWALYVTLAPAWFDPAEVIGVLTPFWVLYAMHDALVKPMPGNHNAPSLAESWTVSPDQRTYEFKLREGVKFHNGDPFTAEDVKFSFARAKGKLLHEKVREVEIVSPSRVRFHLHEPWPDFMTFYGTFASGAAWIVPKKYVEQVGKDGFLKHPIGLGPYKFVSNTPGIELVMEAYEGYWRKMPSVKRIVYKSVPESTTRLAMVKRGETDVAYLLDAPQATEVKRDPTLKLAFSGGIGTFYLDFLEQWDPKSPWADKRVRLAAMHAIDVKALSEAETLASEGIYAYGAYPDIEALYRQQARETDKKKRQAMLQQVQQMVYDRVRWGAIYDYYWPSALGPRVENPALMLIDPYPWAAQLEELKLKKN